VQGKMAKAQKNRAPKVPYVSQNQIEIVGFESLFTQHLDANNRWVILATQIPWDKIVNVYQKQLNNSITGAGGINPRVAIGAIFIKHMCDLSDRETVQQIQENVYMQYFIGYSSFSYEPVFDASLFVDLRKRFGAEQINEINETIMGLISGEPKDKKEDSPAHNDIADIESGDLKQSHEPTQQMADEIPSDSNRMETLENKGNLIVDATACPQDISYPTDLNLLNDSREKAEELIDFLYNPSKHDKKPRAYREIARKVYLKTAQKKKKTKKEIRIAIRKQLSFLKRDIKSIYKLLDSYERIPFNRHQYKYFLVIQTIYDQQEKMYREKIHSAAHRIVSIHQPHVRPIVRGKTNANVEFGAKIQMSIMNGITFLEDLSWDAFNEGSRLISTVENYKRRFGYYPQKVFADKIYCNRDNRAKLKERKIILVAKPLGRPSLAVDNHIRPGERNPIEGKFGQAKTAYGMNRIKARLSDTSESWIASIVLVLNLIKIIGRAPVSLLIKLYKKSIALENLVYIMMKNPSSKNKFSLKPILISRP
jgi:transposase, IS5 family